MTTVTQLAATSFSFLTVAALFTNVDALGGWSFAEVGLLYGMASTAFSLADTFISQVEMAGTYVRSGGFDRFLVRPVAPMLQLCATEFAYRRLNKIVQAIVVLGVSMTAVSVRWDVAHLLVLVESIVAGAVIYGALWVVYCSISFWAVNTNEFVYAAVTAGDVAGRYPFDVFRPALRRGLTAVVPIGFTAYYPACWLLGRPAAGGFSHALLLTGPAVALPFVFLAQAVWQRGLRQYQGTGS